MTLEFWKTEPGWVPWRAADGGLLPFNTYTRMAKIIEDEDESARVNA